MKILLVEDDALIRAQFVHILKEAKLTVDTAEDGISAFEKAKKGKYHVILLDIMLPGRSGYDVIAQLRMLNITTPILGISALNEPKDRIRALDMGADDYVGKMIDHKELIARIKSLYRRQTEHKRNLIKWNDIIIDMNTMKIQRKRQAVDLTKKELGIFLELVRNAGSIVSREDLVDIVWGDSAANEVKSNTIDVHIKAIRQKLEKDFGDVPAFINTVRGYGYSVQKA